MKPGLLRTRYFRPYATGNTFTLKMYDLYQRKGDHNLVGIRFFHKGPNDKRGKIIFEWMKPEIALGISPFHCIDSDEAIRAAMGFITLRPGDTDPEYFENYNEVQMEFAQNHAEWLSQYSLD